MVLFVLVVAVVALAAVVDTQAPQLLTGLAFINGSLTTHPLLLQEIDRWLSRAMYMLSINTQLHSRLVNILVQVM